MRIILSIEIDRGGIGMKRIISILLIATISISVIGCTNTHERSNKYVASFYPLEFILQRLSATEKNVINVTPVGAEAHELELSPDQVIEIEDAKFVLAMGNGFAPSVDDVAKKNRNSLLILDKIKETANSDDPHFWLDPVLMQEAVDIVYYELIKLNPNEDEKITKNYEKLSQDLANVDTIYKSGLSECKSTTFITSHDAFGYMAKRYGLTQESIAGFSPENEPSGERLNELSKLAKDKNAKVIFSEELASDKLAKALAKEVGIKTETLNAIEFLTKNNKKKNQDYVYLMTENLSKIKLALDCL